MRLKKTALFLPVAVAAFPVLAGDFYMLAALGGSRFDVPQESIDNALRQAGARGLQSGKEQGDTGYKVQVGYQFNPNLAIEGGYVDLGKASYNATFIGGSALATIKAHGANLAVRGIVPVSESLSLFAKLGAINAKADTDLRATGFAVSISSTQLRANFGLGATYQFSQNLGARLEYEQFYKLGDNRGGTERVDLWSVGLVVRF